MDKDSFDYDLPDLDLPPVDPDEPPDGVLADPPPPEPQPRRPTRHPLPDPQTGPWFPLAMLAFVAKSALGIAAILAGAQGGEALAYALGFGMFAIGAGFFMIGGSWFSSWVEAERR